jgi:hypothetical protein
MILQRTEIREQGSESGDMGRGAEISFPAEEDEEIDKCAEKAFVSVVGHRGKPHAPIQSIGLLGVLCGCTNSTS